MREARGWREPKQECTEFSAKNAPLPAVALSYVLTTDELNTDLKMQQVMLLINFL